MTKKLTLGIITLLLVFLMIPEKSFASLPSQTNSSAVSVSGMDGAQLSQTLGTGWSGNLIGGYFYIKNDSGTNEGGIRANVLCYTEATYTTPCTDPDTGASDTYTLATSSPKTLANLTWDGTFTLNNSNYYKIIVTGTGVAIVDIYGCSPSCFTNGTEDLDADEASLNDLYFVLMGVETNTNTRIISSDYPETNDTLTNTNIPFEFTYYYNSITGGYATSGIKVINILTNFQYTPQEMAIIASGQTTENIPMTLDNNSCFSWEPYLRGASSTIYGDTQLFETGTGCTGFQSTVGDTSTTSLFAFLNVKSLLKTKNPTGYIYIIGDILSNLSTTTATSSLSVTLNLASTTNGYFTGDIIFFSENTIKSYLTPNILSLFRNLMVVIIWIGTALSLYRIGIKTFT